MFSSWRLWQGGRLVLLFWIGFALAGAVQGQYLCPRPLGNPALMPLQPRLLANSQDLEEAGRDSCWIDAAAASKLAQVVWLDVRGDARSRRFPLKGGLLMDVRDAAQRKLLGQRPIVLVGTGLDLVAVHGLCRWLSSQGLSDVFALRGGERAWRAEGWFVGGKPSSDPDVLTPQRWVPSLEHEAWRVLTWGIPESKAASLFGGDARGITVLSAEPVDLQQLQSALANPAWPAGVPVMVMPPDAASLARWRASLAQDSAPANAALAHPRVWWLEGGWAAFASFLDQQQHVAANAERSLHRACGR